MSRRRLLLLVGAVVVAASTVLLLLGRGADPNPKNDPGVPALWVQAHELTREVHNALKARKDGEAGADGWYASTHMRRLGVIRQLVERTGLTWDQVEGRLE